ncbi:MAG TPA: VWA domain-containing protein [Chthoniobacterales bacterium]|nr:VWA domain-containing protein [Chthoniobacterales bacterium]
MDSAASATTLKRGAWLFSPVLVVSVVVHLLFAGGAAYYVVSRYSAERKLTFQGGPKSPNPSQQALQHRVQMEKRMQTQSQPAAVPKRVLTTGISKVALPEMPDLPMPKTSIGVPKMAGGGGAVNFSAAAAPMSGGGLGGTGSRAPVTFFGIRDVSTSVVIMIDVSNSMFARTGDAEGNKLVKLGREQSFQSVRDEAIKLVQSLSPGTQFGIVRWSGGAYPWKPALVPATDANKSAAIAHIQSDVDFNKAKKKPDRPGGTRHDYALEEAFKLKPETVYMITDGNATGQSLSDPAKKIEPEDIYRVVDEGQKTLSKKARVHAIYYITGKEKADERQMLQRLASRTGGQFREVEAKNRKE